MQETPQNNGPPFQERVLRMMRAEGWLQLTPLQEEEGGVSGNFSREREDLFLFVAAPGLLDVRGNEAYYTEFRKITSVLVGALDRRIYDRVLLAIDKDLPPTIAQAFTNSGVDLWSLQDIVNLEHLYQKRYEGLHPALMRVQAIRLENFKGFTSLTIELPADGPIVLAGENGAGKSSLLQATRAALAPVLPDSPGGGQGLRDRDIQIGVQGCHIEVTATHGARGMCFAQHLTKGGQSAISVGEGWTRSELASGSIRDDGTFLSFPLLCLYGVNRSSNSKMAIDRISTPFRLNTPGAILHEAGRSFLLTFFSWFKAMEDLENQRRVADLGYRDWALEAARKAIRSVMGGYDDLRVDRDRNTLLLRKRTLGAGSIELEFGQLSDGERTLLAMVGDIAFRLSLLNPGLTDPLLGGGVVMIDEIELHLHPAWQRQVVERLQRTFPNLQFILTTHSPQVLSHIPTENIVLLERGLDGLIARRAVGGHGWDSNRILDVLMGVSERPEPYKRRLQEVGRLLDDEAVDEARRALDDLRGELGEFDLEIMRLQAILEFLED